MDQEKIAYLKGCWDGTFSTDPRQAWLNFDGTVVTQPKDNE